MYIVTDVCICDGVPSITHYTYDSLNDAVRKYCKCYEDALDAYKDHQYEEEYINDLYVICDPNREYNDCIMLKIEEE